MEAQIQFRCVSVANDNMDRTVIAPRVGGPAAPPSCATPRLKGAPRSDVNTDGDDRSYSRLAIERAAASHALFYSGRAHSVCRQLRRGQPSQPRTGVLLSNAKIAPTVKPGPISAMTHLPDRRICQ